MPREGAEETRPSGRLSLSQHHSVTRSSSSAWSKAQRRAVIRSWSRSVVLHKAV